MATPVIGYIRTSTSHQLESPDLLYQRHRFNRAFPDRTLCLATHHCPGHTPLADRPELASQLQQAADLGVPLWLEHPDRLLKTYDPTLIQAGFHFLARYPVQIRFLSDPAPFQNSFLRALSSDRPRAARLKRLVRLVDQHLVHRASTLTRRCEPSAPPPLNSFSSLKGLPHYPVLRRCADFLLELQDQHSGPFRQLCLHAYLGRAYNARYIEAGAAAAKRRSGRGHMPGYYELPQDVPLFHRILDLEQQTRGHTLAGAPKPLSNFDIASQLNREGFRNRRGNRFTAPGVWKIRNSAAFEQLRAGSRGGSFPMPELEL